MTPTPIRTLLLILSIAATDLVGSKAIAGSVGATDALVKQWLALEQQLSALNSDWMQSEPLLKQRLSLLQAEQTQLETMLAGSQTLASDADQTRNQLIAEQNQLEQEQQDLQQQLGKISQVLAGLNAQLPPAVNTQASNEGQLATPENDSTRQLQAALDQMTALINFDQRITVTEAVLATPNGEQVLVKQLYLGLARAWFSNQDGTIKGTGQVSDGLWQWQFDDSLDADEIQRAIAMFEKRQTADFIALPFSLGSQQ